VVEVARDTWFRYDLKTSCECEMWIGMGHGWWAEDGG